MAVFRVEKNSGYTVMSNHHLRNRALSLKAKGLLSQMLSLPEDWDYTLQGLARINRESIDAIRQAIRELEQAGYIQRSRERDEKGRLRGADYVIFELPQPIPASVSPTLENPTLENPTQENPTLENPMQLNKDKLITEKQKKEGLNTDSIPIHSPNPLPLDEDEAAAPPPERTGSRKETAYQIYRDLILENIEYDTLTQNPRIDREQLDEIVDILLETVCTNRKSIRVAGDDYPAELVKAKFLKLGSHHIEFVMDCLRDNTTKVRNIKQYLRAMLFNAPSTINSYYASLVAHDMAQPLGALRLAFHQRTAFRQDVQRLDGFCNAVILPHSRVRLQQTDRNVAVYLFHIVDGGMGNFYVILLHLFCSLNCANALAASTVSPF